MRAIFAVESGVLAQFARLRALPADPSPALDPGNKIANCVQTAALIGASALTDEGSCVMPKAAGLSRNCLTAYAVAGRKVQFDSVGVGLQPGAHNLAPMHTREVSLCGCQAAMAVGVGSGWW